MKVIANTRNEYLLQSLITSLESDDELVVPDVNDAYRRLQIPDHMMADELVFSYYQSLCETAAAGSMENYKQALKAIAQARQSNYLIAKLGDPGVTIVQRSSADQPVGLDNIGNTCYLNSLLQYYYTVKVVRDVVMNFDEYRMVLEKDSVLRKRVGGRAVSQSEIVKAQQCRRRRHHHLATFD